MPLCSRRYFSTCTHTLHPVLPAKEWPWVTQFFFIPPENDSLPNLSNWTFITVISKREDYVMVSGAFRCYRNATLTLIPWRSCHLSLTVITLNCLSYLSFHQLSFLAPQYNSVKDKIYQKHNGHNIINGLPIIRKAHLTLCSRRSGTRYY